MAWLLANAGKIDLARVEPKPSSAMNWAHTFGYLTSAREKPQVADHPKEIARNGVMRSLHRAVTDRLFEDLVKDAPWTFAG
jgi:hypothetical protein